MDAEESKLLKRSVELGEENNSMLRSMRRAMHISSILTFTYWVLIIGSAVGAYYFLQPYLDQVYGVYNQAKNNLNNFSQTIQNIKK